MSNHPVSSGIESIINGVRKYEKQLEVGNQSVLPPSQARNLAKQQTDLFVKSLGEFLGEKSGPEIMNLFSEEGKQQQALSSDINHNTDDDNC